jgi:hypothetical protein
VLFVSGDDTFLWRADGCKRDHRGRCLWSISATRRKSRLR